MRKATEDEKRALESMLLEVERDVVELKTRVAYLDGLFAELHRQTKGDQFRVRNPLVWQLMWDAYGMAVIDIASFTKGLLKAGGFFNKLGNHLIQLRVGAYKRERLQQVVHATPLSDNQRAQIDRELRQYLDERLKAGIGESLRRLFPDVPPNCNPTHDDLRKLKDRLAVHAQELMDERDSMTAHRYEGDVRAPLAANVEKLKKHFSVIEEILEDIRLCSLGSQYSFEPLCSKNDPAFRDLIDQLLVGSINYVVAAAGMNHAEDSGLRFYYQFRDRMVRLTPHWTKPTDANSD